MLFALALVAFITTLPYFTPSNIFQETNGRLQTSTDVLFNRLAALRPLTVLENTLRGRLESKEGRLLYFAWGPTVAECSFCLANEPLTYIIYMLPEILTPHLVALAIFGFATSTLCSGDYGTRWRTFGLYMVLFFLSADLYTTFTYDIKGNTRATQLRDIDFFYWRMRLLRRVSVTLSSMVLALGIWLSSTNRFFLPPVTPADRVGAVAAAMEKSTNALMATGNVRNAVVRSKELRDIDARYWQNESALYEEREVIDAIRIALSHVDMNQLQGMAAKRSDEIVGPLANSRVVKPD